jgi:dihydrodipicolinate synthase/N-acetylneuraminate lyase
MTGKQHSGLTVSLPLFFNKDESIDYKTLTRYIDDLNSQNCISAVYSMAYNTCYRMLSEKELLNLNINILKQTRQNNLNCYVGHPYIFNKETLITYLKEISKYKPNGISMLYPERYFDIDKPILDFLQMPDEFGMKVVLHEMKLISGFTGKLINWPEHLLREVIQLDCLIGVKEDSKDDNITSIVLEECQKNNVTCILAGGGKERALKFVNKGLKTWLNGSTMFYPKAIDAIYTAIMNNQTDYIEYYLNKIEKPFFHKVVDKYGWHISHKAALEFFGYGERYERFPHAYLPNSEFIKLSDVFNDIKIALDQMLL